MRLIDGDALKGPIELQWASYARIGATERAEAYAHCLWEIDQAPTIGGRISVKDSIPEEHDSLFAKHEHLSKHMWAHESDNVIVYVRFPDGTGRATEGRLQDGKWWTRISPILEPVVTHWMPLPDPPKEVTGDD